jgi:uncharacterized membrane protein
VVSSRSGRTPLIAGIYGVLLSIVLNCSLALGFWLRVYSPRVEVTILGEVVLN